MKPEDVILDAGTTTPAKGPKAKPGGYAKHVVMRVDRADGFVGRNFLTRGALEHGFYNEEVDGVLLDRVKFFWAADYGHLSFTSDHNLVQNCEGFGAGDAAIYPGASPETGSQATDFYPDAPRDNTVDQEVRHARLGARLLGLDGQRRADHRTTTSTATRPGSRATRSRPPATPASRPTAPKIDHNYIYSNNLDLYRDDAPVDSLVGVPIGTGILYAGMNDARRPRQLDLRQLARRRDRCSPCPTRSPTAAAPRATSSPASPARARPATALDLVRQPLPPQQDGPGAERLQGFPDAVDMFGNVHALDDAPARASRTATTSGGASFRVEHRELLVREHGPRRDRGERHRPGRGRAHRGQPAAGAALGLRDEHRQQRRRQARLPDRVRQRARRGHRARLDCDWWATAAAAGQRPASEAARIARAEAAEAFEGSPEERALERRVAELTPDGRRPQPRRRSALLRPRPLLAGCGDDDSAATAPRARASARSWPARRPSSRAAATGVKRDRGGALRDDRGHPGPAHPAELGDRGVRRCSDEAAYEMFQHTCEPDWSASLRLYKLYARAQAFAGFTGD